MVSGGGVEGGDRVGMTGNNCHVHLCLTGSWLPGIFPSTGRVDVTNSHASISLHVQKYELFLYVASYISETRPGWIKVQIFFPSSFHLFTAKRNEQLQCITIAN